MGATVQPIANGFEFLMGTFLFNVDTVTQPSGSFQLDWVIPPFTSPGNRGQIATWTDGDGAINTGAAQFAEMFAGGPVNFIVGYPVPEPSSSVLVVSGLSMLGFARRRRW